MFGSPFLDLLVFILQGSIGLELSLNLGTTFLFESADLRIHLGDNLK
jgi:hypothetical protein